MSNHSNLDPQPRTGNTGVICANSNTSPEVSDNNASPEDIVVQPELRLEFLVDWLQGTYPVSSRTQVFGLCSSYFGGGEFIEQPHGIRYYQRCYKNPAGILIGIDQRMQGGSPGQVVQLFDYLEIRADVLGMISCNLLRTFMRELKHLGFRATRIDATMDVFNSPFTVWDVHQAFDEGNIRGFRDAGRLTSDGRQASKGLSFALGHRGSAGSGKYLLFYDKFLESKGKRNCLRCELSLYSHYAQQTFDVLCESAVEDWIELIKSLIVWSVDFIDRSSASGQRKQACRAQRLFWWKAVVENTVPAYLASPRLENSIQKMQAWVKNQVAPTLALLKRVLEFLSPKQFSNWLLQVLADGAKRFSPKHRAALEAFEVQL